jgi:flagellar hook-associated protein 3 FlgL
MRISTSSMYSAATSQLGSLQTQLARTQQQLSTTRRMLSAADDPIAAARALEVTQSQAMNAQFATNRQSGRSALSQEEVALTGVQNLILDVQQTAVAANSGTNTGRDRSTYADDVAQQLEQLVALANSSDGNGGYLFGGYRANAAPYVKNGNSIDYQGDQGRVQLQVGASRKVAVNDPGSSVFANVPTGNGVFVTKAASGNAGTGVIGAGTVSDTSQLNGHSYQLDFSVAGLPAVTSYTITDTTAAPPAVGAAVPYSSGDQIEVGGMRFPVTGNPADTDSFTVQPSGKQTLFTTLSNMIDTLRAPANTPAERQALADGMGEAIGKLAISLDNVLTVRASVGSRLKEFDALDSTGADADLQYETTLSNLQDLDLVKAYSDFTQQQTTLEAAQKTFQAMSSLSLFNLI